MARSEERNNGIEDIRSEYMRVTVRVNMQIGRRVSRGLPCLQALTELTQEIVDCNYNAISSPPRPGSSVARRPSIDVISRALSDLDAARRRESISATMPVSPHSSIERANLENAVRNLGLMPSSPRPPNQRIAIAGYRRYLADQIHQIETLRRLLYSRGINIYQWERTPSPIRTANVPEPPPQPPRRAANVSERTSPPRRNLGNAVRNLGPEFSAPRPPNQQIATADNLASLRTRFNRIQTLRKRPPGRAANVPERTPPPRRTANDLEGPPPPERNANVSERTSPPQHGASIPL